MWEKYQLEAKIFLLDLGSSNKVYVVNYPYENIYYKPKIIVTVEDVDSYIEEFIRNNQNKPQIELITVVHNMLRVKFYEHMTPLTIIPSVLDYETLKYALNNLHELERVNQFFKKHEKKKKIKIRYTLQGRVVFKDLKVVKITTWKIEKVKKLKKYSTQRNTSLSKFLRWG